MTSRTAFDTPDSSSEFARRVLSAVRLDEEEQTEARKLRRRVNWEEVMRVGEAVRGKPWGEWAERHGDWGRDGAIYVAVRSGGLRLAEVVQQVDGLRYQAAAQALKRFGEAMGKDRGRRRFVSELKRQLSIL